MVTGIEGRWGAPARAARRRSGLAGAGPRGDPRRVKAKHLRIRIEQCLALAKASNCPRRKFGALLLDPGRNVILMDGYNGGPRGGGGRRGGAGAGRRGGLHAEMIVICNAAASGVATRGAWIIVTGEPCVLCAKLIHHAGIAKVIVVAGGYAGENGVAYLRRHGIEVEATEGPRDPRLGE